MHDFGGSGQRSYSCCEPVCPLLGTPPSKLFSICLYLIRSSCAGFNKVLPDSLLQGYINLRRIEYFSPPLLSNVNFLPCFLMEFPCFLFKPNFQFWTSQKGRKRNLKKNGGKNKEIRKEGRKQEKKVKK